VNVFTRHFQGQSHEVGLFDIDYRRTQALAEKYGCIEFDSLSYAVSRAELCLLCTPIKATPQIILDIAPHLREDAMLCEITSLKQKTVAALKKLAHVRPLSIHPMFGPDVETIKGKTLVVVPVLDREVETATTRSMFPGAQIVVAEADLHDSCMASVLSLPYFMNLAFARSLSPEMFSLMKEMAGTTFTVQLAVTQSIVGESPELIESLINENSFSWKILNQFIDESKHLRRLLKNSPQEIRDLIRRLRDSMDEDSGLQSARRLRNEVYSSLKK